MVSNHPQGTLTRTQQGSGMAVDILPHSDPNPIFWLRFL